MRFSTWRTEISLSIRPSTFSSRSRDRRDLEDLLLLGILTARCDAIVSASFEESSIWVTAETTSGETFLLSFT